jgi:transcriptional regulator with XRE-family HTH domain
MTQRQFSQLIGYSAASVTKWIRSERQPSEAARQRAGELLGVPPDQLFSDERQLLVHSMQHRED